MSAAAATTGKPKREKGPRRFRLARAEFLKLRKHRGLVATTALLTIGIVALVFLILAMLHVFNPDHHGPAGGSDNFRGAIEFMSTLSAAVAAALVGAFAATGDVDAGVFRDLVTTGRSRAQLFLARVPGGMALLGLMVGIAFLLVTVLSLALAGGQPKPSLARIIETGLWIELCAGVAFALALGVGSVMGSRGGTIAILLAWLIVVQPIVSHIGSLGNAGREWLPRTALIRISPIQIGDSSDRVPMSVGVAIVVIVAWIVVPLAAGLWRTQTRDA